MIVFALAIGLVMSAARLAAVWQTGTFFDTDDAMRLVEVRNWLAGQGWFDLNVPQLDPPRGVFLHWSRIVDLPLAGAIAFFRQFMPLDIAERATRILFPLALQAALYLGMARLARLIIGPRAVLPIVLLTLMSGMVYGQFQPGRIDHHAPQIVILVFMIGAAIEALDPRRAKRAALAGALAALSLAISLETLPFIAVLSVGLVVAWIARGAPLRLMLIAFACGLGLALPAFYLATIGPSRWGIAACDALSTPYLAEGCAGAAACGLLGLLTPRLARGSARALAALAFGSLVPIAALCIAPACISDPFAGLDPLLREIWLQNVYEAWSLWHYWHQEPGAAACFCLPLVASLIAAAVAICRTQGLARDRWLFATTMMLIGTAMSFWMIRVLTFVGPLALLSGAWAVAAARPALERRGMTLLARFALLFLLPFTPTFWALILPPDRADAAADKANAACLAPAAFAPLRSLPPGLVLAPIDAGSHLIIATPDKVLAAPYHRNNHGNRLALDTFMAAPDEAHAMAMEARITYVATCPGLTETEALAKRAPQSLAAALLANHPPLWLRPIEIANTPYRIFSVAP